MVDRKFRALFLFCLLFISSSLTVIQPVSGKSAGSLSPQQEVTPAPGDQCGVSHGILQQHMFLSTVLNKRFYMSVYTPPCFEPRGDKQYPVLYLLRGQSFNDDQWSRLGVTTEADRLITAGVIDPLIIIMPRESAYLDDTRFSAYGDALVREVVPWVESSFPVVTDPDYHAIGGISRGAGWALRVGLMHPEMFGAIGLHSLAQFPGDFFKIPAWRKATPEEALPRIYLDIGLLDFVKDTARTIELQLSEYSYPHEWHLNTGTHNEEYWSSHVTEYLVWYSRGWMG